MSTSPRPSARGGIQARKIAKQERLEGSLYERQALTDYGEIRARVQSEAVNCAICGQLVHPDNMSAHMLDKHPIVIDPEFHELIPPQSEEETEALTASLLSEGCRDALVVWDETNTLIDGHHRYDICSEHGITYGINRKSFESREDVIVWMISNQLSRRNITTFARSELATRMEGAIAAKAKANQAHGQTAPGRTLKQNSSEALETREKLADIAGVSHDTITKVKKIAAQAPAAITKRARAGDISVNRAYELTKALKDAPEIIVNFVTQHEIEEPDKVALLVKGYADKREWCEELLTSEYIQPGDETEAVHYSASILDWKKAIEIRQMAHAQIAMDNKRGTPAALQMSESNEWYTPAQYIETARLVMGAIDLDPATCEYANRIVKAAQIYTISDNGLHQDWHGRVWLNPPYGRDNGESNQEAWSKRLIQQYRAGTVTEAILLVNAVTDRAWFQPLWQFPICFTDHRVRFYNTETDAGQPTHGNAFVYLGDNREKFIEEFSKHGAVVTQVVRRDA